MNYKSVLEEFNNSYGGSLKHTDNSTSKVYYFHLNYKEAVKFLKALKGFKKAFFVFSKSGNHKIYSSLEQIKRDYNFKEDLEIGKLYTSKGRIVVADKE